MQTLKTSFNRFLFREVVLLQPVKKFNAGAVSVSVWENPKEINGKEAVLQSISVQRSFKDSKGE